MATESFTANGGDAVTINGATYQVKTVNPDGSYDILTNAGGTIWGQRYGSYDNAYTKTGFRYLETFYSGVGGIGPEATKSFTADGGYTGAINGVTYQVKSFNADGSYDILTDLSGTILGKSYGSTDNAYAATGLLQLSTFYSGAGGAGVAVATESFAYTANGGYTGAINGATYQVKTVNADGSSDILTYVSGTILGQSYGSFDNAYAASGFRDLETFYSGAGGTGAAVAIEIFTPAANGGYTGAINGVTYQVKTVNADGSYDILTDAGGTIWGKSYGSSDTVYAASGLRALLTYYSGVGGTGSVVATETFTANGGYAGALNGVLYQFKTVNADGSSDVLTNVSGATWGQTYASYDYAYTASGFRDLATYYGGAGGTGAAVVTASFTANGGDAVTINGALHQVKTVNPDGSYDVLTNVGGATWGQTYASCDYAYTASGFRDLATYYSGAGGTGAAVVTVSFTANGGDAVTINGALHQVKTVNPERQLRRAHQCRRGDLGPELRLLRLCLHGFGLPRSRNLLWRRRRNWRGGGDRELHGQRRRRRHDQRRDLSGQDGQSRRQLRRPHQRRRNHLGPALRLHRQRLHRVGLPLSRNLLQRAGELARRPPRASRPTAARPARSTA